LLKLTIINGLNGAGADRLERPFDNFKELMDNVAARQLMVDQQIRTWEVLDPRVLDVLSAVPRERFVPSAYRELAFADAPIPIGFGQTMLAPKLQGRILQALGIGPDEAVLEVGTGTGYLSTCMGLLARETTTLEIIAELAATAGANISGIADARVRVENRDAFNGAPLGEYDAIAVTGSLPVYDPCFERALRIGGRLFVVVGSAPAMDAMLVRRVDSNGWVQESLFETVIAPLVNARAAQRFVF
jgi:protein-L-isoaspartate(D-aspartate) O-methyltransferase